MRIIADVDTGIDDALALISLASNHDVDLVGVTTSTGNTTSDLAARNSAAVLKVLGRDDIPVFIGSSAPLVAPVATTPETHGEFGLGYSDIPSQITTHFSNDGIPELGRPQERRHPGEITLLITGPLTNLALALRAEPALPRLAHQVVVMGGAFNYPGNTTPTAEWNSWCDPHAAAEVYAAFAGLPPEKLPIIAPLNVTETVQLLPRDVDVMARAAGVAAPGLSADAPRDRGTSRQHSSHDGSSKTGSSKPGPSRTGSALIDLLTDALCFYFEFHAAYGYGYLAQVHDLLAAQIAMGDVVPEMSVQWVGVETESELTRGTTVADFRHLWNRPANARIVTAVDGRASVEAFIESVKLLSSDTNQNTTR